MDARQARWATLLTHAALLAWCASALATPLHDPDVWFHLSAAREMATTGRIPFEDGWTWVSAGRPWLDLHWGFQALVGAVYGAFGAPGLVATKMVLGTLLVAVALDLAAARRREAGSPIDPHVAWLAVLPLVLALSLRPVLRPELLTFLLLALQMRAWVAVRSGRRAAVLAILALQAGLANVQGLFVLGWLLGGAFLVDALLRRRAILWHVVTAFGLFVTSLLNPYGWHALELPLQLLRRIDGRASPFTAIAEFHSSFARLDATAVLAATLAAATVAGAVFTLWRRAELGWVGFAAATVLLAVLARRNLTLAALAVVPLVPFLVPRLRGGPQVRVALASGTFVLASLLAVDSWNGKRLQPWAAHPEARFGVDERAFPGAALAFLRSRGYAGRHFIDLNHGGYDVFWNGPDHRCLVDARLEVLGEEGFARYLRLLGNPAFFERTCEEFAFEVAVLDHRAGHQRILLEHVFASRQWVPVHADAGFVVFARRSAARTLALRARPSIAPELVFSFPPAWARRLRESARGIAPEPAAGP